MHFVSFLYGLESQTDVKQKHFDQLDCHQLHVVRIEPMLSFSSLLHNIVCVSLLPPTSTDNVSSQPFVINVPAAIGTNGNAVATTTAVLLAACHMINGHPEQQTRIEPVMLSAAFGPTSGTQGGGWSQLCAVPI